LIVFSILPLIKLRFYLNLLLRQLVFVPAAILSSGMMYSVIIVVIGIVGMIYGFVALGQLNTRINKEAV